MPNRDVVVEAVQTAGAAKPIQEGVEEAESSSDSGSSIGLSLFPWVSHSSDRTAATRPGWRFARRLVEALSAAVSNRTMHLVTDSAYAGKVLRGLPPSVTWTTRLRFNASLYALAPPSTGKRGRPRLIGEKLPSLAMLAGTSEFTTVSVTRYGTTTAISVAVLRCLWCGVFGPQEVQVVMVKGRSPNSYDIALVTTDLEARASRLVERYAARWSIEVAIEDAKQVYGVGQARNRLEKGVQRTVSFGLVVNTLAICWYATAGHDPEHVEAARALAPGYRNKAQPSVLDMNAKLHRVIIAAQ